MRDFKMPDLDKVIDRPKGEVRSKTEAEYEQAATELFRTVKHLFPGETRWFGTDTPGVKAVGVKNDKDSPVLLMKLSRFNPEGGEMRYRLGSLNDLKKLDQLSEIRWFVNNWRSLMPNLETQVQPISGRNF